MRLERFPIPAVLDGSVESIWAFDNPTGLPVGSLNLSVANGKVKLLFSIGNHLIAQTTGKPDQRVSTDCLSLVGLTTQPMHLVSHGPLCLMSIEFAPGLACRFLNLSLASLTNMIWPAETAFGVAVRLLERQLIEQPTIALRLNLLTDYLARALRQSKTVPPLIDFTVDTINRQAGLVKLTDLCRKLGYSHRHVDKQFLAHVGVTPKLFARIVRFQKAYKQLILRSDVHPADLYQTYYDQPHYIREFKLFAGHTPGAYVRQMNPFGELFYR